MTEAEGGRSGYFLNRHAEFRAELVMKLYADVAGGLAAGIGKGAEVGHATPASTSRVVT